MNQIERIKRMSGMLKTAQEACIELDAAMTRLAEALEKYDAERSHIEELSAYYDSEEWLRDFSDDEAGLIPEDIDRGALSEDGIYNLLSNQRYLEDIMQQLREFLK